MRRGVGSGVVTDYSLELRPLDKLGSCIKFKIVEQRGSGARCAAALGMRTTDWFDSSIPDLALVRMRSHSFTWRIASGRSVATPSTGFGLKVGRSLRKRDSRLVRFQQSRLFGSAMPTSWGRSSNVTKSHASDLESSQREGEIQMVWDLAPRRSLPLSCVGEVATLRSAKPRCAGSIPARKS